MVVVVIERVVLALLWPMRLWGNTNGRIYIRYIFGEIPKIGFIYDVFSNLAHFCLIYDVFSNFARKYFDIGFIFKFGALFDIRCIFKSFVKNFFGERMYLRYTMYFQTIYDVFAI